MARRDLPPRASAGAGGGEGGVVHRPPATSLRATARRGAWPPPRAARPFPGLARPFRSGAPSGPPGVPARGAGPASVAAKRARWFSAASCSRASVGSGRGAAARPGGASGGAVRRSARRRVVGHAGGSRTRGGPGRGDAPPPRSPAPRAERGRRGRSAACGLLAPLADTGAARDVVIAAPLHARLVGPHRRGGAAPKAADAVPAPNPRSPRVEAPKARIAGSGRAGPLSP
jgi:hypothetical protein